MYEIIAQLDASSMRLCRIKVRLFDGYVKTGPDEVLEDGENNFSFVSHKRRVMDEEVINQAQAFRVEVSRAMAEVGLHTELGTLVNEGAMREVRKLEREFIERAAEICDAMTESLRKHQADESLAKCEVALIVLKVQPEEASAEETEELIDEAAGAHLKDAAEVINETVARIRELVSTGNVPRARRLTSTVERAIRSLEKRGWREEQLSPLRADLELIKEVLGRRSAAVAEKLAALDEIKLMSGVKPQAERRLRAA